MRQSGGAATCTSAALPGADWLTPARLLNRLQHPTPVPCGTSVRAGVNMAYAVYAVALPGGEPDRHPEIVTVNAASLLARRYGASRPCSTSLTWSPATNV
jgi:hypothetical protein